MESYDRKLQEIQDARHAKQQESVPLFRKIFMRYFLKRR